MSGTAGHHEPDEVSFKVGGKAHHLLTVRLRDDAVAAEALRDAEVRKVGRNLSVKITAPHGVVERMSAVLEDAASDRAFDSCSRTQYRTAGERASDAIP